jgi:hypothetical protein
MNKTCVALWRNGRHAGASGFLAGIMALLLVLLPGSLAAQQGASGQTGAARSAAVVLPEVLEAMAAADFRSTLRAAFGSFTYEYSDLPTPFARWLEDRLAEAAPRTARLQLLNRNAAAAMDPAFRAQYQDFFRETGTDALLHGRYFLEGSQVRVRLELTDFGSGTLIDARDWLVAASTVPSYASVKPAALAQDRAAELARLAGSGSNVSSSAGAGVGAAKVTGGSNTGASTAGSVRPLQLSLATDRGSGAAYRQGEELTVLLAVNKDAWVRLYHVDAGGHIQMIWPNRFGGGDGRIRPGTTVAIPGPGDPFCFVMTPPFGTEFLKAVASSTPFSTNQADFADLGNDYRAAVTRGLEVTGTARPEVSEALAAYNIGP